MCEVLRLLCNVSIVLGLIEKGPVLRERRNPWDSVRTGFNKRETGPVPQERRNPWNSVRTGFNKRETGPVPQERRNPWDSVRTGFGKIETGPVPQERRNPWNSVRTGFNKRETGPVPQERRNPWDSVRTGFGKIETGQLFSQYIVDMYAKIESERLLYIRLNQKELRVEEYIHLRDAVANDGMVANFGKLVILPATFTGSPRHMHEYTQDAMVFVRTYGRPDLFITFTCNPSWPEINAELFNGQKPMDRHDLTARVFKLKLNKLIALITKQCIFGETRCWMFTIEWQKRGLPHSHILIWLKDKIHPIQIDNVISAEIPNPEEDPNLYEVVIKNMIHGPCGTFNINAPCMKNGKCSKNYPRDLISDTQTGFDGYPRYRRRAPENGGFKGKLKGRGNTEIEVDNKWVVPYSPLLSRMFKAHINVEYCHSVKSIKYICKYVNKGNDMAIFGLSKENTNDEISQYLLGRYISSNEAVWRILSFPIHERHPNVVHLSVHLENGQRVYFTNANARTVAAAPPNTTLTAFFQLCQQDPFAKNLLYPEVPRYYTWNASRKSFCRRKQGTSVPEHEGIFASEALGRVYTVHPNNAECFFLRMLLHTVRGPTSFSSLKCVNGEECRTFREACQKLGLLEDDQHWDNVLSEAASQSFPEQIRELFAILLTTCNPSNPQNLWEKYRESMSEDVLIKARRANPTLDINFSSDIFNEALLLLQNKCLAINDRTLSQLGLQSPERCQPTILNRELMREKNYNIEQLRRNDAVDEINNCIQDMLPGSVTEYNSINTMVDVDDTVNYPSEFLNSLNPSGLPPHHLRLKIGSPIMLLRNLDPPKLCNGTRLCVKRLLPNVIEATILTGKENGKDVLIPRIPLIPNDFPFLFKRLQFPYYGGDDRHRRAPIGSRLRTFGFCSTLKRDRDGEFPEIEEALFRWIRQANAMKLAINGNILKEKAILLALKMGQDNFEASNGWIEKFKARRNIAFKRLHGEAGSVDANSVATWKGFVMDEAMEEVVEEEMNRCFEALKKHQAIDVNYIDFLEVDKDVQVAGEQSIEEIVKEIYLNGLYNWLITLLGPAGVYPKVG
ncbi:hypothetical protein LAZ67_14001628 [Cordylochernes scorpioides]|uniref:HTH CENPB-type domain-containing protein n=1 Tax=Cordylochernes scorpioides TaxID=51811 RepID=A0ABY6L685_9ARAC|nr:hypothetical protein LAZ67_14001628 [Cordylochernes scorpioides]